MKRSALVLGSVFIVGLSFAADIEDGAPVPATVAAPAKPKPKPLHPAPSRPAGKHPRVDLALKDLSAAKRQLEAAAKKGDDQALGDHPEKARELIDQAIQELEEGLKVAKTQGL